MNLGNLGSLGKVFHQQSLSCDPSIRTPPHIAWVEFLRPATHHHAPYSVGRFWVIDRAMVLFS